MKNGDKQTVSFQKTRIVSSHLLDEYKQKSLSQPKIYWHDEVSRGLYLLNKNLFQPEFNVSVMKDLNHTPQKNYSSRFRRFVGMSPGEYITHHRIAAAKWLLMDERLNHLPISDVGYAVGYERPHSFTMTFKNRTGVTPREWRKKHERSGKN
ncbi:MAG: AraC family transcriptional regulator [Balneolaceae bacterium]|nr:MAG: AraC family transcriptional regulator [Balneolaceae bacterium]